MRCGAQNTPASVIFLGKKVYIGVIVILASQLLLEAEQPISSSSLFDNQASLLTVRRWLKWWKDGVAKDPFWKKNQGLLRISTEVTHLVVKVWNHFEQQLTNLSDTLHAILKFFSPITIPQNYPACKNNPTHLTWPSLPVRQLDKRGWSDGFS